MDAIDTFYFPNAVYGAMMMRMEYETAYGIFDHKAPDDPKVPWPLLAVSPKESLTTVDPLAFRMAQFAECRVTEAFGMSFDVAIRYPRRQYLMLINAAKEHAAKMGPMLNKLSAQMDRLGKDLKDMTTLPKPPAPPK